MVKIDGPYKPYYVKSREKIQKKGTKTNFVDFVKKKDKVKEQ